MTTRAELLANAGRLEAMVRVAELEAEVLFLLGRAAKAGGWYADPNRCVGISSNALVWFAFRGEEPDHTEFPRDPSDLAACIRTVRKMPAHLRARVEASTVMDRYRSAVEARYPLDDMDAALAEEEKPNG